MNINCSLRNGARITSASPTISQLASPHVTASDKVSVSYSLSLDLLNAEHKPSVKKHGRPRRSVIGQAAGHPE